LIVRAMALGEVTLRDWWRVAGREIQAGLSLGAILGTIGTLRVALWSIVGEKYFHRELYGPHWPLVAMTVGLALLGVVLLGALSATRRKRLCCRSRKFSDMMGSFTIS